MEHVSGQTAFITGGASGIGLAIGKALAQAGCRIVLADINADALATAAAGIAGEVEIAELDVRDRGQWAAARAKAEARFGTIGILINNAGVMNETGGNGPDRGLIDQSPESFDRMIAINLTGVFNGIHEFAPGMADRGNGHIVNTASTQGVISCAMVSAYCASKFGVVGMSEALRQELAPLGVGVSVLCPGVTQTNLPSSTNRLVGKPGVEMPAGFGMDPAGVAALVVDGIVANRLYIFTHGEYIVPVAQRQGRILAALADTPISPIFDPTTPLAGTPEYAAWRASLAGAQSAKAG